MKTAVNILEKESGFHLAVQDSYLLQAEYAIGL